MLGRNDLALGTLLVVGSAVAYSLSGYFTRSIAADIWTVLFWRGLFGGLFIGACMVLQDGRNTLRGVLAIGKTGLLVTLFSTVATISYISALRLAPVADVMTVHAALPFVTMILGVCFVGEREDWTTWAAAVAASVGVMVIFDSRSDTLHLAGYVLAIVMVLSYAAMLVVIRKNRDVSMLPAACLSGLLCALLAFPLAAPSMVGAGGMPKLVMFGTIQFGGALMLMAWGARLVSAPRAALIGSIENPLAPLWVWLAFGESPSLSTWIGGSIVMTAVFTDVLIKSRRASVVRGSSPGSDG